MKVIIKILITVALVNAAARVGLATASYYQLKDDSQQLVTFGEQVSTAELQSHILEKARSINLPIADDDVQVTRVGSHTMATAAYTQEVEVFPTFIYPINFHFSVESQFMSGLTRDSIPARR
jgi:hypothetical protein